MKRITYYCIIFYYLSVFPQNNTASKAVNETIEETSLRKYLETVCEDSKHVNSPDKKISVNSRLTLENLLDWNRTAMVALGEKRWQSYSSDIRSSFRDLLKEIILLTAYERLDKFWADIKSYEINSIKITNRYAHITTTFYTKDSTYVLEYNMFKQGAKWLMSDIIFEGMKYSENIHEQIEEFLKENSLSELIKRLKKRRDELKSESK